ncbi:hypothetical protein Vadar_014601 [Vaccinium darrowii]|uniref:Uncharacterized protein n=1 Tax=Vaccinium darrowii TaxID=229202 RepID=A0ACB7XZ51_9ERIC|nr:hypothetical protein Vadar_014601 [Vaccinium darrowii]
MDGAVKEEDGGDEDMEMFISSKNRINDLPDMRLFKEGPHPYDNQRRQLSRDLGLEPKHIKSWFQNKRTQTKAQSDQKVDKSSLRLENEKIQCENLAIKEAIKNVICRPPFGEEERKLNLQKLKMENSCLKTKGRLDQQNVESNGNVESLRGLIDSVHRAYLGSEGQTVTTLHLQWKVDFIMEFVVQGIQGLEL